MNIKIIDKNGVTLKTKGKYCKEDISVSVDESLMGVTPTGTYQVTENGEYDITQYAKVNVNVAGSGEGNTLKKLLDYTKTCYQMFRSNSNIRNLTGYLSYNDTENVTDMSYMFSSCYNLTNIPQLNTSKVTNMSDMFNGCSALIEIPQLDTSNVTNMSNVFYECRLITTIPQLNTSKVTNMSSMFYYCNNLTTIPQLNTSNVTKMNNMFNDCKALTTIPQLNTSKVTNMSSMFNNCYSLKKVDISYYNLSSTSNSSNFCNNCYSLKAIIIRGFGTKYTLNSNAFTNCYHLTGTVDATNNPDGLKDAYIYVPKNMCDTLKSATNWSTYADQIRALEDYTVDGTTTGELDESKI